jgi:3-isopropylmalate dehydrogenase
MATTRTSAIAVLPGDGIGPEVTREAVRVLRATGEMHGLTISTRECAIGGGAVERFGTPLPDPTRQACLASDAVLLGAVGGPQFDSLPRPQRPETGLLGLRLALGGFANLRPAVAYVQLQDCSPLKPEAIRGANVLFVRELLGGLYFGSPRGTEMFDGELRAFNTMTYSRREIERVARVAFEAARGRRGKVTSVDKANVLECSQLWRDTVTAVAGDYPGVALEHMLVDSCAMKLVTSPASFDVVVTENLFGDVLSDEASAITGSLGMLPSATIGGQVDLYEPIHGSAPDIAGRGIANPLGAIATVAMLFRYTLRLEAAAAAIESAIEAVLDAGHRTADLAPRGGRTVGTSAMGDLVLAALPAATKAAAEVAK